MQDDGAEMIEAAAAESAADAFSSTVYVLQLEREDVRAKSKSRRSYTLFLLPRLGRLSGEALGWATATFYTAGIIFYAFPRILRPAARSDPLRTLLQPEAGAPLRTALLVGRGTEWRQHIAWLDEGCMRFKPVAGTAATLGLLL